MFGSNNSKPTASLSSSLLARKGHARPAMRPQGFLTPAGHSPSAADDLGWNDMGDNRYYPQPEAFVPQPAPVEVRPEQSFEAAPPPVLRQREALDEQLAAFTGEPVAPVDVPTSEPVAFQPVQVRASVAPALPVVPVEPVETVKLAPAAVARIAQEVTGRKTKAAFTLRLDTDRHLKLRLASAVRNRSAQQIVTEALDAYLTTLPELGELARQVPSRKG